MKLTSSEVGFWFHYVCFSALSIAMCVKETNKKICMVFAFDKRELHGAEK